MRRILPLLMLLAMPALAQGLPTAKPAPLGAPAGEAPSSCPAPLANACLAQQGSCRVACPPMWSMNPSAPAFTPTDRAGCMQRCFQQYLSCRRLHGC